MAAAQSDESVVDRSYVKKKLEHGLTRIWQVSFCLFSFEKNIYLFFPSPASSFAEVLSFFCGLLLVGRPAEGQGLHPGDRHVQLQVRRLHRGTRRHQQVRPCVSFPLCSYSQPIRSYASHLHFFFLLILLCLLLLLLFLLPLPPLVFLLPVLLHLTLLCLLLLPLLPLLLFLFPPLLLIFLYFVFYLLSTSFATPFLSLPSSSSSPLPVPLPQVDAGGRGVLRQ